MMTVVDDALAFDAEDRPLDAIKAYEAAIARSQGSLQSYVNLAVLYFLCTSDGFAGTHGIPPDLVDAAFDKVMVTLDEAEERFGWHPEIQFWRRYVSYHCLGEESFYDEAEELLETGQTSVPCFYLIGGPTASKYVERTKVLLDEISAGRTAKERYITSVLRSHVFDKVWGL